MLTGYLKDLEFTPLLFIGKNLGEMSRDGLPAARYEIKAAFISVIYFE